jgi:hypothetical protein
MEYQITQEDMDISAEPEEAKKTKLMVIDSRNSPDPVQAEKLSNQIEADGILGLLEEIKSFLGKYSTRSPQELSVNIVDGKLGEGTIRGIQIDIQMPAHTIAIKQLQESLKPSFGEISTEVAGTLALAIATSTILHEGVHGILDSTPNSQLAADYERVSGTENTDGFVVTLLDEGITYAIQGRYARTIEPIGSLAPRINDQEDPDVKRRKALGEKLKPKVDEYMKAGREIDDDFLAFTSQAIKEVEDMVPYV